MEEAEAKILEMSHCEMGAELARHWDLPEPIITVLRYHHAPKDPHAEPVHPLIAMLDLAGKLLSTFGFEETSPMEVSAEEWQALGIDPVKGEKMKAKVQEHVKNVAEMNA
jgi:HD-like signal output (HDOD) protein